MTWQGTAIERAISQDVPQILNRKGNAMNPEFKSQTTECGDRTGLTEREPRSESTHSIPGNTTNIAAQFETGKRDDHSGVATGVIWG